MEFRLDLLGSPSYREIERCLSRFGDRCVMAVRPPAEGGGFGGRESDRLELLQKLAELSPAYLDVELSTLEANPDLRSVKLGKKTIVSWHDAAGTPGRARLLSISRRAASYGGFVKLVPTAVDATDNLEVLSLYDRPGPPPVAFCMGTAGLLSRVLAMEKGSPIAYASLPGEPTAPGQFPLGYALAIRRMAND